MAGLVWLDELAAFAPWALMISVLKTGGKVTFAEQLARVGKTEGYQQLLVREFNFMAPRWSMVQMGAHPRRSKRRLAPEAPAE